MHTPIEILFVIWLGLIYFSLGQLFLKLSPGSLDKQNFFTVSTLGLAAASLIGCVAYYSNINTYNIYILLNALAIIGLLGFIRNQKLPVISSTPNNVSISVSSIPWGSFLISAVALAVLMIPGLIGSTQFVLFRGNHYDAFNYLEMASTYARFKRHDVLSLSTESLTSLHGFYTAAWYMHERPLVSILYAIFQHFNTVYFTHLHYYYLTYSLFLSGGLIATFIIQLRPTLNLALCNIAGFGCMLGFWGQYILDLDAWSQVVWTPLQLLTVLLWIQFCLRIKEGLKQSTFSISFVANLIILCVASFCMYFEGFLFFGLPLTLITILCYNRRFALRFTVTILTIGISTLLISGSFINLHQTIGQVSGYSAYSANTVEWWRYYDSYIFGASGTYSSNITTYINEITSALGLYFFTPSSSTNYIIKALWVTLLGGGITLIAYSLFLSLKDSYSDSFIRPTFILILVSLIQCLFLMHNNQYWSAGKCLSYIAAYLYIILVSSLFSSIYTVRLWGFFLKTTLFIFIASQFYFSLYRIYRVSTQFSGIHYISPYPSAQDAGLTKKIFSFNDLSFLKEIKPADEVGLYIEDPWIEHYIQMVLISHSIPYHLELPICEQAKFNVRKGNVTILRPTTIRIHLSLDKTRPFPYFIKADSI